jgi:alpha-glucosidase
VTREIIEKCAKHKLLVDFHDGPIPPSGDRRTWPNVLGREFCHAQSDAKRSFDPTCFTTTVFVNMLAGPLDMTNGLYDLNKAFGQRDKVFQEVYSTAAGETARVLITFSGLNILHDHGDAYAAKADLFEFIRELPMTWDETRVLHGEIGRYITTARRRGDAWFIGSATNEDARSLPIYLDFLREKTDYTATLYEDAPDAHYKTNREAYQVRTLTVRRGDLIDARMAPGGGHSVWIRVVK